MCLSIYLLLQTLLSAILFQFVSCKIETDQERLYKNLITGYNKLERPVNDAKRALNVSITFELLKIFKLSSKKQKIDVVFVLTQVWHDRYLQWNASQYNGFSYISIPPSNIWVPDVGLYNEIINKDHHKTDVKVKVITSSDGTCRWSVPMFLHAFCHVDVSYLPLDIQHCTLQLGSLSYAASQLNIMKSKLVNSPSFLKNGEWTLYEQNISTDCVWDMIRQDYFTVVEVTFKLQRNSAYYIIEMFVPCILISGLTVLGFLLPPESGERMSLGMLILLSMTFFQQLTLKMFPLQEFPLISKYFLITLIEIGLALLVTTITINFYYSRDKKMPKLLKTIIHEYLGKITRIHPAVEVKKMKNRSFRKNLAKTEMTFEIELTETMSCPRADAANRRLNDSSIGLISFKRENEASAESHRGDKEPPGDKDGPTEWAKDWMIAAKIVDRFAMYASFLIGFVTILTIFLQSPIFWRKRTGNEG